jgi:hypothetical protein
MMAAQEALTPRPEQRNAAEHDEEPRTGGRGCDRSRGDERSAAPRRLDVISRPDAARRVALSHGFCRL